MEFENRTKVIGTQKIGQDGEPQSNQERVIHMDMTY